MIDARVGPYLIRRELGQGGMGTVYLAEVADEVPDLELGAVVALKVVHPHLLSTPGFFKRFLREAAVGKQVDHENVVRTYDVDATLVDGRQINFMVMEYVEGKCLRVLKDELGTLPENLALEIAEQMAAGLAALHARGIVHRDLKPENVLITDDHRVRIMDLGVAKLQEASVALTREGQFAGSFLYAAPEQFGGRPVGPPADLYSLGVLLYELASGDNPFRRDDAAGIIQAHLHLDPPPLTDRRPSASAFFSEVLSTLLAKDPADRLASAADLAVLLREGERSEWWAEREQTLRAVADHLPSIPVARDAALQGREAELAVLEAAWERARAGEGNVLFLEGEPGIGKTRLVDAFARARGGDDAHVLYGSYPPSGGMGGLSDAVIGRFGSAGLEEGLRPYLTVTPTLVPAFAALIQHDTTPTGAEPLHGDALHAVVCHLMQALAAEKPTIWMLDDLHFAPSESRQLALSMARAVGRHRVLLILTARPGLAEEDLTHFSRLPNFQRVTIPRLGAREIIDLLSEAFRSKLLAEKLGGKIAHKSDGVPFFVFEMIRSLREGGMLSITDGKYTQTQPITDIEVPSAVKDLIEARLRELSKDERAILDVGAVQGVEFDPDLIARVLEQRRVRVLQDLAEIELRTGIVRATGRTYRFDQYQIHEIVLGKLSEVLREDYHTLLAESFAAREGIGEEAEGAGAVFMARHHLHGSEPGAGRCFQETAVSHLVRTGRVEDALSLVERALGSPGLLEGAERCQALIGQARRWHRLGRRDEERRVALRATECADELDDPGLRVTARLRLAASFENTPDAESGITPAEEALELARETGDSKGELAALGDLGQLYWQLRRYADAHEYARLGLARSEELGWDTARPRLTLGIVLHNLGRYAEAKQRYEECARIHRERENLGTLATCNANIALIHSVLGDFARARRDFEDALVMCEGSARRYNEGYLLHELGELAEREGRLEDAKNHYATSTRKWHEGGRTDDVGLTLVARGRLALTEGDEKTAIASLDEALELGAEFRHPGTSVLGAVYRACLPGGSRDAALAALAEYGERCRHREKIEAHYVLYKLTARPEHLAVAHELTEFLRENAPEDLRASMPNNPLFRDIAAAWAGAGHNPPT
jgi:tetratricopeptide (TPR) repeat protein/predicted Ser/Thr protein kinase